MNGRTLVCGRHCSALTYGVERALEGADGLGAGRAERAQAQGSGVVAGGDFDGLDLEVRGGRRWAGCARSWWSKSTARADSSHAHAGRGARE